MKVVRVVSVEDPMGDMAEARKAMGDPRKLAPSVRFEGKPEIRQVWEEHASLAERAKAEYAEDALALDDVGHMIAEARRAGDRDRARRLAIVADRLTASSQGYLRIAVAAEP